MERDSHHHILKPLLNGFLTAQLHALTGYTNNWINFHVAQLLHMPSFSTAYNPISTKKVKNSNNGRPLSLYQEAQCGLTSGLIASIVGQPLLSGCNRVGSDNLTYTKLFTHLSHTVTMMGVLASYNPALSLLRASESVSNGEAQIIGAGIISGFFGAACAHPWRYIKTMKDVAQKIYEGGKKDVLRHVPDCVARILTPYSGFRFYKDFLFTFHRIGVFATVQWWMYEHIRTRDE